MYLICWLPEYDLYRPCVHCTLNYVFDSLRIQEEQFDHLNETVIIEAMERLRVLGLEVTVEDSQGFVCWHESACPQNCFI